MNQKGYLNILIILVVILVGVVGYLTLIKKYTTPTTTNQIQPISATPTLEILPVTPPTPTLKQVNWEALIPTIRTVIGPTFLDVRIEESRPLSIFHEGDITGDGISEALVSLGSGGAYTSYLTLMRIENDKTVVAQFKQKDGKVSPLIFLVGASAMNGEDVKMLPNKNAIYAGHWSKVTRGTPFGNLTNCSVEVYQWNSETKIFDFSESLSNEIRPGFCQEVDSK